jgi:hypothetical protein
MPEVPVLKTTVPGSYNPISGRMYIYRRGKEIIEIKVAICSKCYPISLHQKYALKKIGYV